MNKLKSFLLSELNALKSGITKGEYALWWVIRILLAYALIRLIVNDPGNTNILLISVNLTASFLIPIIRLICLPKNLVSKIPFRGQTWLNILIFFSAFLGQGMGWNHSVTSWDKVLHVMAGSFVVLIGNELVEAFIRKGDKISPLLRTFAASGFSCAAMVLWEIFEFFVDYYWPLSTNQAYNILPDRDPWFQAIFGLGAQNENQWAVFDTNVDMLCAIIGAVPVAVILLVVLTKKEKKAAAVTEEKETVTA